MNTKTEKRHTPTPWTYRDNTIRDATGLPLTLFVPGVGETIVRAVNAHEDLLEAAKIGLEYVHRHGPRSEVAKIDAAIAKAQETV